MPKPKPKAFALLIGINDYSAYDASMGLPPKTSDLRGAVHDLRQYWRMARALGIPASNIRVLCAPAGGKPLSADGLPGNGRPESIQGASLAEIEAGITWLAGNLDTSGVSAGMISVSSHGSYDDRGSLICASDTRLEGDALTGALPMRALLKHLARRPDDTPVTIFLDACDAGTGAAAGDDRSRVLRGRPAGARKPDKLGLRSDDLILAASAPGTQSFEITVADSVRGAFSWATLAVLERWGVNRSGADTHFDITYGHLQERVDALLEAMNVGQTSHFDAPEEQAARKVFAEELSTGQDTPERPHYTGGREVSPGTNGHVLEYKVMKNQSTDQRATIYVPGKKCSGWEHGKMYWFNYNNSQWTSFKDALSWNNMTIKPGVSKKFEDCPSPTGATAVYATGDVWTSGLLSSVAPGSSYGSFTFGSINGYIIAESTQTVTWLLDSDPGSTYLVDGTDELFIKKETSAPTSGSYFQSED